MWDLSSLLHHATLIQFPFCYAAINVKFQKRMLRKYSYIDSGKRKTLLHILVKSINKIKFLNHMRDIVAKRLFVHTYSLNKKQYNVTKQKVRTSYIIIEELNCCVIHELLFFIYLLSYFTITIWCIVFNWSCCQYVPMQNRKERDCNFKTSDLCLMNRSVSS